LDKWLPEQWDYAIQRQAQAEAEEDEGFSCCFGWFPSIPWFLTTAPKRDTDHLDCYSLRRASNEEPTLVNVPTSKLNQQYICEKCPTSFTQPDLLSFHKEKRHSECNTPATFQEPNVPEEYTADRNLTRSDSLESSDASGRTLVHATSSNESIRRPGQTLPPTPALGPTLHTIISLDCVNAFVQVQRGPDWIQQGPQMYSWENFRGLDGAKDAMADFLDRNFA
jgi:hypothetical protein